MKKFRGELFQFVLVLSLAACQQSQVGQNVVKKGADVDRSIGDADTQVHVVGRAKLDDLLKRDDVTPIESSDVIQRLDALELKSRIGGLVTMLNGALPAKPSTEESLIVGLSYDSLAKEYLFGGVITRVSQKTDERLGMLKLSDFKPAHVFPQLVKDADGKFGVGFFGCVNACSETSPLRPVIILPLNGVNEKKEILYVDLSVIASGLNIVQIIDPIGMMTQLTTNKAEATEVDYSDNTLVFNVVADMTRFTNNEKVFVDSRWFLRARGKTNTSFVSREQVEGVGYFTTDRNSKQYISRHALLDSGTDKKIKYYIKHVPDEYKKAFSEALDSWNDVFEKQFGKRSLVYEFLDVGHPLHDYIVTGDIRFNVIEWDLVNQAPYGGLGPSIADQKTGEVISANVLIQGPAIIELYSGIFSATKKAASLRASGNVHASEMVLSSAKRNLASKFAAKGASNFKVSLNKDAEFFVPAQSKMLQDPLFAEDLFFDLIPGDLEFAEYMHGYFKEMVAHEIGHNLGLRHNFRGNLFGLAHDDEAQQDGFKAKGKVSASIMEYLGIPYRHLNGISEYDIMAIAYGYKGVAPHRKDLFCTDDNVGNMMGNAGSAECSREDAGSDPFGFFEDQIRKSIDLLLLPESEKASPWEFVDIQDKFQAAVEGLVLYGNLADKQLKDWTNFFNVVGRPKKNSKEVKAYVVESIRNVFCDDRYYKKAIDNKKSVEDKQKATMIVKFLKEEGFENFIATSMGLVDVDKKCNPEEEVEVEVEEEELVAESN